MPREEDADLLIGAVERLRGEVEATVFPLELVETAGAAKNRDHLLAQFDDYVIPRLKSLDAPLLAVIGGSTGAGKSTLVNSIVGADVSKSGVLRPTTTSPVLVHHPDDAVWFRDTRILPSLARVTGTGEQAQPGTVRLVESRALPAGLALLDAPDIDSVVHANRTLATQLLLAADLWLFVTTAARYADAVPWDLLRQASERGTAVAIVLDRVDPEAIGEVRPHLQEMLREQGLSTSPVFTVPESRLDSAGRLPAEAVDRLRSWLEALAGDARARSIVVSQTLRGAMASLDGRTEELADASRVQAAAAERLARVVDEAHSRAVDAIEQGMSDGTLLRGEVLARWQDFVGTGDFFRQIESTVSRLRDRLTNAVKGETKEQDNLGEALQTGVAALVQANLEGAASATVRGWRGLPGGDKVLTEHPDLAHPADLTPRVERIVREWQGDLLDLIRRESGSRRTNARIAAYGINGIGLCLMLITFLHTAGLSGGEIAIAGGTTALAQKVLEAIFGDQAVRDMATRGRALLVERVDGLVDEQRERFARAVGAHSGADRSAALLDALEAVREAQG
jgi:hypothetical protein